MCEARGLREHSCLRRQASPPAPRASPAPPGWTALHKAPLFSLGESGTAACARPGLGRGRESGSRAGGLFRLAPLPALLGGLLGMGGQTEQSGIQGAGGPRTFPQPHKKCIVTEKGLFIAPPRAARLELGAVVRSRPRPT